MATPTAMQTPAPTTMANQATNKAARGTPTPAPGGNPSPSGGNSGQPPNSSGGNAPDSGNTGGGIPYTGPPAQQKVPAITNAFPGQIGATGGPTPGSFNQAGQSFQNPNPRTGAVPFWQSPDMQIAMGQTYNPGMQYANQQVTGQNIPNNPFVQAAEQNFQQTVLPGIQDQFNNMGLGRSSAAGNAMAMAQGQMLEPLYQQAAQQEQQRIQNQVGQGQYLGTLGLQQQGLQEGASQFDTNLRQQAAQQQAQGQQQLFQNLMGMQGQNYQQQMGAGNQLFQQGTQAQQTGQAALTNAYQDFLRQQGLSESAINPFGSLQGLLGTVTTGK